MISYKSFDCAAKSYFTDGGAMVLLWQKFEEELNFSDVHDYF
ncbi:MAG: hypothetical protein QNJ32_30025 [Xenococcaceae cyanobacterium MO_167.B27]|nr:hypothetical protein [Xenococcaceae cyanobacterium MO_167.B27]